MGLKIYNTLGQNKQEFKPVDPNEVKIYLCGPTVYDLLHIGNFRGAITFNLIRNWMEASGYKVKFVYNYTDVDDKIINKAIAEGVESSVISERYIKEFEKDFARLGLRKHDVNPRVTEFMPQIIQYVQRLIGNGHAYEVDGEVFYSVDSFPTYGQLSGKKLDELEAGQRVEVDQRKKNPFDFVLWKPSKPGEPSWESPWGKGRPGWHIECSAMIHSLLGDTIDIHGGGIDLIFPHHENEVAQGEGATGKCYCNYWIHNNFINLKDQKMSKSLGNVITGRSFMDRFDPEILKFLYLSVHYRSPLSISDDSVHNVMSGLSRIYEAIELAQDVVKGGPAGADAPDGGLVKLLKEADKKIKTSLDDDFNSSELVAQVFEVVRAFNSLKLKNKKWSAANRNTAQTFLTWIDGYGKMCSLFQAEPSQILSRLDEILITEKNIDRREVEQLVQDRLKARDSKDFALSDKIRDQLLAMGVELQDGTSRPWRMKV